MNHFKMIAEDGTGGFNYYEKNVATALGAPFGEQVPVNLHRGEQRVAVEFEGGAVARIPASRALLITEM